MTRTAIVYYNLRTNRYLPNTATSFELALAYSAIPGATLVKVADDVYRIRRANGRLSNIELRAVTLTDVAHPNGVGGRCVLNFRNEDPIFF